MNKYSEKEIQMFTELGHDNLLSYPINPVNVYNTAMESAFVNNKTGPAVEALRLAVKAIKSGNLYRLTKEFDDLITFEKPNLKKLECPNCKSWLGNFIRKDNTKICVNCKYIWR